MMNKLTALLCLMLALSLLGCDSGPDSPRGFSLPEGDIAKGETVFMKYQCLSCHSLQGYEDESIAKEFSQPVMLGGTSSLVKTYGQLVTSVINPSHKLAPRSSFLESVTNEAGNSKMRLFNDVMTVSELVDLVAFLQPKYEVKPIQYTTYGQYRVP
ncbi:MAG: sulfur-oxidizing protein SoxX [Paraglaciecola sp.]|jgi:sulfur-oxidizing protein SoxX